ncbi:MAG TPA: GNAT family N-acetyltransferase [Bacilli bacterium]|nr:GNAT family N-acetyltransferase [Bacilli bacterium]
MFKVIQCNTQTEIFDHLSIRHTVFVKEQNVSMEEEFDFLDRDAILLNGILNNKVIATARILKKDGFLKIGRVAVLKEYRKHQYGSFLMTEIEVLAKKIGYQELHLSSQVHAKPFYESLGYQSYGEEYYDANILHVDMVKKIVG